MTRIRDRAPPGADAHEVVVPQEGYVVLLCLRGEREQLRARVAGEDIGDLGPLRLEGKRAAVGKDLHGAEPGPLARLRPREHHVDGRAIRDVRAPAVRPHQELDAGVGAQRCAHAIELAPVGRDRGFERLSFVEPDLCHHERMAREMGRAGETTCVDEAHHTSRRVRGRGELRARLR